MELSCVESSGEIVRPRKSPQGQPCPRTRCPHTGVMRAHYVTGLGSVLCLSAYFMLPGVGGDGAVPILHLREPKLPEAV